MSTKTPSFTASKSEPVLNEELVVKSFFEPLADLPIAVVAVNKMGYISFFNAIAGYFLGIPTSFALHKPLESIMPNSDILDVLETGLTVHDRQEFRNGRLLKCSLFPIQFSGKIMFGVKVMQDVSEKIALETELSKIREKYEMLDIMLDQSFEELGAVDDSGRNPSVIRGRVTW
jgi:transcriptional regulator with PAS, ATPase and Fis domain